jgi:ATP-dependent Clp protease protease subunit
VTAYKAHSTLSEEEIRNLMDEETWILPEEALEYGFATSIEKTANKAASQNAKMLLLEIIKQYQKADTQEADEDEEEKPSTDEEETEDTEDETTDEESPEETEEEPPEDDEDGDETEKKAEQSISAFFKAILKM